MTRKAKFKVNGMHCNSCAILIEEKLKDLSGVINARINFDSQKGVIVYDEEKITENSLYQAIKEAGDYQVVKIEETELEEELKDLPAGREKDKEPAGLPKIMLLLYLLVGFSLISLILNVVLLNKLSPGSLTAGIGTGAPQEQKVLANNPQPSLLDQAPIAQFEITKDNHVRGDFNASITLVEFSDFECPFCERHYPTLNKILEDYKGKVRLVYKHFPLGFHPNAQKAAEASECADEQGRFWEYHDKLFENLAASGYSVANFKQWAKDLGLDSGKFNGCLDSGKFAQKVKDDFQEGSGK
ncbi:MAG: thioredoxin domain-containing protein, partial [Candidatus Omnitrophota bacterium]|nr:thioredoxin domain-containing protein [Candidatus Omnitrophota bacterium]